MHAGMHDRGSRGIISTTMIIIMCVVLNQISPVYKVYYKYRKQTLLQKYLDHHGCLERRHDFTKDPSRSQKHCFLEVLQVVMTWNNVQPPCNTCVHCAQSSQDHRNQQCSTMPHAAYLHSQFAVLRQLLSMFFANVAISRTTDINKKTSVCLLISETDVWTIGFDLPAEA